MLYLKHTLNWCQGIKNYGIIIWLVLQAQLRNFIPEMLKYSTGRSKPGWGKEECRPHWWPDDLPWQNVRSDARTEEEKRKVQTFQKFCVFIWRILCNSVQYCPSMEDFMYFWWIKFTGIILYIVNQFIWNNVIDKITSCRIFVCWKQFYFLGGGGG